VTAGANPTVAVWAPPADWRAIDFISDLHLAPGLPRTADALGQLLLHGSADAVCLLGDVFETWVGDDARSQPFERSVLETIARASRQRTVCFMAGNRDFLLGRDACAASGMQALPDPTCLYAWGRRWLLCHGDAQCLSDTAYQSFRTQVRSLAWQQAFLARPLDERIALARTMRAESLRRQRAGEGMAGDLDPTACRSLLQAVGAPTMLHGHTHRPATHDLGGGLTRHVLSDWDLDDLRAPRAEVLRLRSDGSLSRLTPAQACVR
jgi:UDP-2,3-diacylglucosamine hydrolase